MAKMSKIKKKKKLREDGVEGEGWGILPVTVPVGLD